MCCPVTQAKNGMIGPIAVAMYVTTQAESISFERPENNERRIPMGDGYDHADIERFVRSSEGQEHLEETRRMLVGLTIQEVSFSNETHCLATTLHLDDGETFVVFQPSLEVQALREQFEETLEREYYVDFPERKETRPCT